LTNLKEIACCSLLSKKLKKLKVLIGARLVLLSMWYVINAKK